MLPRPSASMWPNPVRDAGAGAEEVAVAVAAVRVSPEALACATDADGADDAAASWRAFDPHAMEPEMSADATALTNAALLNQRLLVVVLMDADPFETR